MKKIDKLKAKLRKHKEASKVKEVSKTLSLKTKVKRVRKPKPEKLKKVKTTKRDKKVANSLLKQKGITINPFAIYRVDRAKTLSKNVLELHSTNIGLLQYSPEELPLPSRSKFEKALKKVDQKDREHIELEFIRKHYKKMYKRYDIEWDHTKPNYIIGIVYFRQLLSIQEVKRGKKPLPSVETLYKKLQEWD